MRNLTAVFLVSSLIGAGGTLPLSAQTPPATATPATPAPAPAQAVQAAVAPNPADAGGEARRKSAAADHAAMLDAHLAALHAGLVLTPEQDKLWPPVEQAIRGFVTLRDTMRDRRMDKLQDRAEPSAAHDDHDDEDPVAALKTYSETMLHRAQVLKGLADAIDPLYATLSDDQKHRIPLLLGDMAPRRGPFGRLVDRMEDEGPDRRGGERMGRWDEQGDRGDRGWGHRGWRDGRWGERQHHMGDEHRFGEEDGDRRGGGMADLYRDHDGPRMHRDDRRGQDDEDGDAMD